MSGLFSNKSTTNSSGTSTNSAYPVLQQAFGGTLNHGGQANDAISAMLGLGGNTAEQSAAFNNYKNSTGFQSTLDAGSQAITDNNAAHGFLQSGATGKALTNYGQGVNQQYYQNYMNQLLGLSNQALGAGGLLSGAANKTTTGTQQTSTKPGLGGLLGSLAAGIPGI